MPPATAEFVRSYNQPAQATITDIPATVADVAGLPPGSFPGQSVLRLDETASRSRSFAFHTWNDLDWERAYMTELQVFPVTGPIRQPSSWRSSTHGAPRGRLRRVEGWPRAWTLENVVSRNRSAKCGV